MSCKPIQIAEQNMNARTIGEIAFEEYLNGQSITFEHEPKLDFTSKLIDYVVDHPTQGKIYFEVKDIERSPFEAFGPFGAYDPYEPIRTHIGEGQKKFKDFSDQLCALVLFSQVMNLMEPHVMLGAMYGNLGFTVPVNVETGVADASRIEKKFLVGQGKMVQPNRYQNTRIAALISVARYNTFTKEAVTYLKTDDGRTEEEHRIDLFEGRAGISEEPTLCCTVWENGTARGGDCHKTFSEARWMRGGRAMKINKSYLLSVKDGLHSGLTNAIRAHGEDSA